MSERQMDTMQFKLELDRHIVGERELFAAAQQRKREGKKQAAEHHTTNLATAKRVALWLARTGGINVTIEDIRAWFRERNKPWTLGNAAGNVFSGDEWECVGYVAATHPAAHGRMIRQWRLKR